MICLAIGLFAIGTRSIVVPIWLTTGMPQITASTPRRSIMRRLSSSAE